MLHKTKSFLVILAIFFVLGISGCSLDRMIESSEIQRTDYCPDGSPAKYMGQGGTNWGRPIYSCADYYKREKEHKKVEDRLEREQYELSLQREYGQMCAESKSRNILNKVSKEDKFEVDQDMSQIFSYSSSYIKAMEEVELFEKRWGKKYPGASEVLLDNIEICLSSRYSY